MIKDDINIITYGTFDLFHYGHLELLRKAKSYGTKLIVGLSTDYFNEIKGKKSFFNYKKRKEFLNGIKYIDLIIPEKSWAQKENDIKKYNIKYFIIGDDWANKFNYLDCKVIYLPRTKNISSTEIKRIIYN